MEEVFYSTLSIPQYATLSIEQYASLEIVRTQEIQQAPRLVNLSLSPAAASGSGTPVSFGRQCRVSISRRFGEEVFYGYDSGRLIPYQRPFTVGRSLDLTVEWRTTTGRRRLTTRLHRIGDAALISS